MTPLLREPLKLGPKVSFLSSPLLSLSLFPLSFLSLSSLSLSSFFPLPLIFSSQITEIGEAVETDEIVGTIESDKVTQEVRSPQVLSHFLFFSFFFFFLFSFFFFLFSLFSFLFSLFSFSSLFSLSHTPPFSYFLLGRNYR